MNPPTSSDVSYDLPGDAAYQSQLYPPPSVVTDSSLNLTTPEAVIAHYTASSLKVDGIEIAADQPTVTNLGGTGTYRIAFTAKPGFELAAQQFAQTHRRMLDADHAGQAINGAARCRQTPGAWNPMAGYPVNRSDGLCQWHLFLPLGMPMLNHRAVTLLHYPPYVAMQHADYLHNVTLERWQRLLGCVGIAEQSLYYSILDVNPIAAPGSGQSEYPNDYFPVMLSSVFFDDETANCNYIRQMLELMLNPPHNANNPYTLPLLVGGSPLYDPQAPGWFRVRYKDQLPQIDGIPQASVGQVGAVRIAPGSTKLTPYLVANHMIAAGVTGRCTRDPATIPDIRKYTAQDLVAASFLRQYADNPAIAPEQAGQNACLEWFGNTDGSGAPNPPTPEHQRTICINSQIDLFFDVKKLQPMYSWAEAAERCATMSNGTDDPCTGACAPPAN